MRFLIVDDERALCDGAAMRLQKMELPEVTDVVCAYSGEEALDLLLKSSFDALLADIRMGDMDGLTLVSKAKALQPDLLCVMITAYDSFHYAQQALRLGVEDFLVKPCSHKVMKETVERLIERWKEKRGEQRVKLDMMLNAALTDDSPDLLQTLLHDAGIALPGLRVAVWQRNAGLSIPEAPSGVIVHRLTGHHILLLGSPLEKSMNYLESVAERLCQCVAVSEELPSAQRMLGQARQLLSLACACDAPAVITPPGELQIDAKWMHQFENAVRMSQTDSVRKTLLDASLPLNDFCYAVRSAWRILGDLSEEDGEPLTGRLAMVDALCEGMTALKEKNEDNEEIMAFVERFIMEHLNQSINMAVIANHFDMSYTYFSHWFRKQTGSSFSDHVVKRRMEAACALLEQNVPVRDVACRVGYQNPNNFSRIFTRINGISPSQWVRKRTEN